MNVVWCLPRRLIGSTTTIVAPYFKAGLLRPGE
jgi:hypothetical protein